jgi:hypothetical protein
MSLFNKTERNLVPEKNIRYLFEELHNTDIIKEARKEKRRVGIDPDFLKKFFANESKRTIFFETAPLVYYMAGEEEPTYDKLKSIASNPTYVKELGGDLKELFDKVPDQIDRDNLHQAILFLGRTSYSQLKQNKTLGKFRVVDFIRNGINEYRNAIPRDLREDGSKPNTADVILIFKGNRDDVIEYVKNITKEDVTREFEDGVISGNIKNKSVKFIQVSMKKDVDSARIGKVITKLTDFFGFSHGAIKGFTPITKELTESYIGEKISSAWNYIKDKASDVYDKIVNVGQKLLLLVNADSLAKKITAKNDKELSSLLKINIDTLEEEEGKIKVKDKDIDLAVSRIHAKLKKYKNDILMLEKSPQNKEHLFKVLIRNFIDDAGIESIKQKFTTNKTRDNLRPILKLNANVSALEFFYMAMNQMLQSGSTKSIMKRFMELSRVVAAEAVFGDTLLPLWKFYGGERGIEFLGFKNKPEVGITKKAKTRYPVFILDIHKSEDSEEFEWNVTQMFSIDTEKLDYTPEQYYFKIEMISERGSAFSFKIEINSKKKYNKIISGDE